MPERPERVDIRVTFPVELSERLRKHVAAAYGGQRGALTLTITQAVKEFLDRQEHEHQESKFQESKRARVKGRVGTKRWGD